jgi:membrane peptidoglycan carboxypeptidase
MKAEPVIPSAATALGSVSDDGRNRGRPGSGRGIARALVRLTLAGVATLGFLAFVVGAWVFRPIPASMLSRDSVYDVIVEDRRGVLHRSTRAPGEINVRWMPYERIDGDVINAFVAMEDERFWKHSGIDMVGIARTAAASLRERRLVGGVSTITIQLARLVSPRAQSLRSRVVHTLWALRLERQLSKHEILEQYLNRVQLGERTVGVGAASALYFGGSASDLTVAQASLLAGLSRDPTSDNPYVSPDRARSRRAEVLVRMRRLGYATEEDVKRASEEPISATVTSPTDP